MDAVVKYYLWGSIILAILFFIVSSNFVYWLTNRLSVSVHGPMLYCWQRGGPTLSGMIIHSIIFGAIVFGIIDYLYTKLNGSKSIDDNGIAIPSEEEEE
jgi:hypothetical protein